MRFFCRNAACTWFCHPPPCYCSFPCLCVIVLSGAVYIIVRVSSYGCHVCFLQLSLLVACGCSVFMCLPSWLCVMRSVLLSLLLCVPLSCCVVCLLRVSYSCVPLFVSSLFYTYFLGMHVSALLVSGIVLVPAVATVLQVSMFMCLNDCRCSVFM